jgi:hypothetical protein
LKWKFFQRIDRGKFDIPIFLKHSIKTKSVFGSVVAVAFQIAFRAEIHANNIFLFFKNYF